jgi:hypothetical protein
VKKIISVGILALLLAAAISFSCPGRAQSNDESFQQAVTDYQNSPSVDGADKVIKLAVAMEKLPPVPEEARKHFIKGGVLFKEAKSPADFTQALDEFKQAVQIAPWWAEARLNLALACESASEYASAIENLKLYLLFKLPDAEARVVQDKIYALEAKQEKAAKNKELVAKNEAEEKKAQQEDAEAKKAREQEEFLKKINGARYVCHYPGPVEDIDFTIDVLGDTLTGGQCKTRSTDPSETKVGIWEKSADNYKIDGRSLQCYMWGNVMQDITGIITDDGSTITIITKTSGGGEFRLIYKRMR